MPTYLEIVLRSQAFCYSKNKLEFDGLPNGITELQRSITFICLQTQVSIWLIVSMKFSTRIIDKKGGTKVQ